jgi:hypothetical protein
MRVDKKKINARFVAFTQSTVSNSIPAPLLTMMTWHWNPITLCFRRFCLPFDLFVCGRICGHRWTWQPIEASIQAILRKLAQSLGNNVKTIVNFYVCCFCRLSQITIQHSFRTKIKVFKLTVYFFYWKCGLNGSREPTIRIWASQKAIKTWNNGLMWLSMKKISSTNSKN